MYAVNQHKQIKKQQMAIISSYPTLIPNLGDKVLGSNTADALGQPVEGNPTVQYDFSAVKTLVDQTFTSQISGFSILQQPAVAPTIPTTTPIAIEFGGVKASANVSMTNTGVITFLSTGSYYIKALFNLQITASAHMVLFRKRLKVVGGVVAQSGDSILIQSNGENFSSNKPIIMEDIINITTAGTELDYQMALETSNTPSLKTLSNAVGFTVTPSASIIISKLI